MTSKSPKTRHHSPHTPRHRMLLIFKLLNLKLRCLITKWHHHTHPQPQDHITRSKILHELRKTKENFIICENEILNFPTNDYQNTHEQKFEHEHKYKKDRCLSNQELMYVGEDYRDNVSTSGQIWKNFGVSTY